jgi:hypothetical protein
LKEYSRRTALEGNFRDAKASRELETAVKEEITNRGNVKSRDGEVADDPAKRRENFKAFWAKEREKFDRTTEAKRSEITQRQAHEMRVFERIWREEKPQQYRKPSGQLLSMKRIEKSLILMGEIDEADSAHARANQQIKLEAAIAQEKLATEYELEKSRRLAKHEQELKVFDDARATERLVLESDYERGLKHLKNREAVVESKNSGPAPRNRPNSELASLPTSLSRLSDSRPTTLLPPLIAPNDRRYVSTKQKARTDLARKQEEFQRRNAEEIMAQYQVDLEEAEERERQEQSPRPERRKKKRRVKRYGESNESSFIPPEGEEGDAQVEDQPKEEEKPSEEVVVNGDEGDQSGENIVLDAAGVLVEGLEETV